jgi:hypothetical protein
MHTSRTLRHPGVGRDPVCAPKAWIPAYAGMTEELCACLSYKGGWRMASTGALRACPLVIEHGRGLQGRGVLRSGLGREGRLSILRGQGRSYRGHPRRPNSNTQEGFSAP